jgi:PAS domain S-box-containing protein
MIALGLVLSVVASITVRVGYEENPPMAFTNPSGQPDGFYVELVNHIAQSEDWKLQFVRGDWSELLSWLEGGEIDLLLSIAMTPARRDIFLFSENSVYSGWSTVAVQRSGRFGSMTELEGATIAMIHDDIHSMTFLELVNRLGVSVTPLWVSSFQGAMLAVAEGGADGAAVPWHAVAFFGPELGLEGSPVVWNPVQTRIAGNPRTAAPILAAIDGHLAALKADDESIYYALRSKWVFPETGSNNRFLLLALGILALSGVAFIFISNLRLSREVRKKNRALSVNSTLATVAGAVNEVDSLDELCGRLVGALADVMETSNLFVAVYVPERDAFRIPRILDRFDDYTEIDNPGSLTHNVFRSNAAVRWNREEISAYYRRTGGVQVGTPAEQWLGVPLRAGREPVGVVAVQSYERADQFTQADQELLESVGAQLGNAILRLRAIEGLTASRERLARLMAADPSAILLLDERGVVQDCNPQARNILGCNCNELLGLDFYGFLSRGAERLRCFLDPDSPDESFRFTGQVSRPDGTGFPFEARGSVFEESGRRLYFVGIQDATRKLALEAEAARNERLESVGVLAGGIAHDFNNILTGILANLSLLKREKPGSKKFSTFAEDAEKAALSARHLTNQLLTFAQGGAPVKRAVQTAELLEQATRFLLRGSGVSFSIESDGDLWNLEADPGQFSQVVSNLVLNAKQAMNDAGSLSISARNATLKATDEEGLPSGRYVRILFQDSGPGIPGRIADRVFDPYFTTREKGHGLGLTTSHSIVVRHGGRIRILPSDRGALFEVLMPAALAGMPLPIRITGIPAEHTERILILDDEEIVRKAAGNLLSALGCSVDEASDGATAISMYKSAMDAGRRYDAVIMDLTIPGGMGGEQAVREVLSIDPDARVIVSSGYAGNSIMASYRDFGFSGVLSKPYTLSELSDVIRRVVRG